MVHKIMMIIIGYFVIGMIYDAIMIIKDLIRERMGMWNIIYDMPPGIHIRVRLLALLVWPLSIVIDIYILLKAYVFHELPEFIEDNLEEFNYFEKEEKDSD